jgi:hypothetical protein
MALAVGLDKRAVHQCSQAAIKSQLSLYAFPRSPWQPPKFRIAASSDEEAVIPPTAIFAGLQDEGRDPRENQNDGVQLPSVAECAVHLQLLESFQVLREKVPKSNALDRTFSIRPITTRRSVAGYGRNRRQVAVADSTFQTRRQKKWHIFVDLAVARFTAWWGEMDNILRLLDAGEIPPLGKNASGPVEQLLILVRRCPHGLALPPAKSPGVCRVMRGAWISENV